MINEITVIAYRDENGTNKNIIFNDLTPSQQGLIWQAVRLQNGCNHPSTTTRLSSCGLYEMTYCGECGKKLKTRRITEVT